MKPKESITKKMEQLSKNPFVVPLTDSELQSLIQWKKEASGKIRKEFKDQNKKNGSTKKPDWITAEQWKAVPSISWWEDQKQGAEFIKQSKPRTIQEVQDQFSRLRSERNWNPEE